MTDAQRKFVALEREREAHKQYFKDLAEALKAVVAETGIDKYFQDEDGVVYKTVMPKGRWVDYEAVGYERTRREGEQKGSLSLKEARDAGFEVV